MRSNKEMPVKSAENQRRCDELGNHLRCFMMLGLSNEELRKMHFATMASYAPFHLDEEPMEVKVAEASKHYDEFIQRGCGL